jgi:tripartite-type tricarboxylate transporter receptor subunit TctC
MTNRNSQRPSRRTVLQLAAGTAAAAVITPAHAAGWPERPVRIIVAFTPGASTDNFARALASSMQAKFGQPFVVENRPGGGGWPGTEFVAQSPPDGYTLTVNANGMTILGLAQKNDFDAAKDLTPIAMIARSPVALLIPASLPVKNVKELVAYVKAHPNFFYASAGIGSINHLYGELFNQRAGISMKHVPYKGFSEALPDLAANRIQLIFSSYATGAGMIKAGKVRLLAYGAPGHPEGTPDAPVVRDSGINYETSFWWGLFGPGKMPSDIRHKLNEATNEALKQPAFVKLLKTSGVTAAPLSTEQFEAEVKKDTTELKKVYETAKINLQ